MARTDKAKRGAGPVCESKRILCLFMRVCAIIYNPNDLPSFATHRYTQQSGTMHNTYETHRHISISWSVCRHKNRYFDKLPCRRSASYNIIRSGFCITFIYIRHAKYANNIRFHTLVLNSEQKKNEMKRKEARKDAQQHSTIVSLVHKQSAESFPSPSYLSQLFTRMHKRSALAEWENQAH